VIRVIVVDDQAIVRDGLVVLIGLLEGIEVVAEAADGDEAVRGVEVHRPHVVLMDLRMPHRDGVWATERITRDFPDTAVLVLTTYEDDDSITRALLAGARGYLTKDAGRHQLETAIRTVAAGQAALSAEVSRRIMTRLEHAAQPRKDVIGLPGITGTDRVTDLTPRETEVAQMIANGLSNSQIAASLFISLATVKSHVNAIFAKLGTANRFEAIELLRGRPHNK
jgi:DNA-binding NarL/FixJ family response regulator